MHGIQHLFRQQAIEKQSSIDSWQSANPAFASYANGRASTNDSASDLKSWNQGLLSFPVWFLQWLKWNFQQIVFLTNYTT